MSKTAIYPGTFDPITFGHIDVIKKSLKIVDKLIVATTDNIEKDYLFSLEERIEILNKCLFNDLRLSKIQSKTNGEFFWLSRWFIFFCNFVILT